MIATEEDILCYHCGEICDAKNICIADKYFCCVGCKLVYELLAQNNLCQYYDIEKNPGINRKESALGKRFDFLDDNTLISKLLDFQNEEYAKITLFVPQIHCSSCIYLLERLHKINDAIINTTVDFPKRKASITFLHQKISLRTIVELLTNIGYEPKISLNDLEKIHDRRYERSLYYKIGIAGFAFGNIMLLSFPEYLAIDASSMALKPLFGYLIILLSIPVFFYCSSEYFTSAWKTLRYRSINVDVPLSIGIIAFYARSLYEIISQSGPGYMDSFTGLIFFLLIGRIFQKKTYDMINFERDYKSYFPVSVNIKKGIDETSIPLSEIAIGDCIIIRNNEVIPVDAVLAEGVGNIDYSFITGEATCSVKAQGALIYAGGKQVGGKIELIASKNVSQSYLTQLWDESSFKKELKKDIVAFSSQISRYFTVIVLVIAFIAGVCWWPVSIDKAMQVVSAVLIIACPCALALSGPFSLGNTLRILARNKFYIKNIETVERLHKVTAIVFDKTGTMTRQETSKADFIGDRLTRDELAHIYAVVTNSTHPLSRSIASSISGTATLRVNNYIEIEGKGVQGVVDGVLIKAGSYVFVKGEDDKEFLSTDTTDTTPGISKVYLSFDGKLKGHFVVFGNYRSGMKPLIESLQKLYKVFVLSGDTARDEEYLITQFSSDIKIMFNQTPFNKLEFIQELQKNGETVMMVGDGLNDAGALRQSNVGVSISENIINFSPASDAILHGDNLKHLATYFSFIHRAIFSVKLSFIVSIIYNILGLYFAVMGRMTPLFAAILMPVSSVTVIVLTVALTGLFAKMKKL